MFNVSNLDDIVEVDTLPQQNKIEEGFEYSFPILELKNRQRNEYKYSIEQENKEIISLESLIEEIHLKITKKQEELSEQRKILIYITQLLLEAMNNVRSIQMLLREHNMKANLMQDCAKVVRKAHNLLLYVLRNFYVNCLHEITS